jgi:predicted DNA-binding WGR domain protein
MSSLSRYDIPNANKDRVYLECVNPSKNEFKFWAYEIAQAAAGGNYTVFYYHGRIGSKPVTNIKDCSSYTQARNMAREKLWEKNKKGYVETVTPKDWTWRYNSMDADEQFLDKVAKPKANEIDEPKSFFDNLDI